MNCNGCDLQGKTKVLPTGNPAAALWYIGEAPGREEEIQGMPFCGPSGSDHWKQNRRYGIDRDDCYTSNCLKCRPPDNAGPKPKQLECCLPGLLEELAQARDDIIIAPLGRFAIDAILGPGYPLAKYHGLPIEWNGKTVVPCYHPAAGLHQPNILISYQDDIKAVAEMLNGYRPRTHIHQYPVKYTTSSDPDHLRAYLKLHSGFLGLDVETYISDRPYLISLAVLPDLAYIIRVDEPPMVAALQEFVKSGVQVVMHNALFDIPHSGLDYRGVQVHDTMSMAYILQRYPLKLKYLAYRVLGLEIPEYASLVDPVSLRRIQLHFSEKLEHPEDWPLPTAGSRKKSAAVRVGTLLRDITAKNLDTVTVKRRYASILEVYPQLHEFIGHLPLADLSHIRDEISYSYTAQDACAALQLYHVLMPELIEQNLIGPYLRDMKALPMVNAMNQTGMLTYRDRLLTLGHALDQQLITIKESLPFNPNSGDQVAAALVKQKLNTGKRTKKGRMATDKKSLTRIKDQWAEVEDVLEYREATKLKTTYVEGILSNLRRDPEGWRLFFNISMTRASTGRLAASRPNVMAMPYRTDMGAQLRHCFYAEPGCSLVSLDYSQIELRLLAHHCRDKYLVDAFLTGKDPHNITGSRLFGKPPDQLDPKKERLPSKTVNFGIIYGVGATGLRDTLRQNGVKWSWPKCQDVIQEVKYKVYPGVGKWIDAESARIRRTGESRDMVGRRRLIPGVQSTMSSVQEAGLREGINNIIQSGAQAVIKTAMGRIWPICLHFQDVGYKCHPLLQVHDELIFLVSNELISIIPLLFQDIMVQCADLIVPLEVDYAVGTTWGEL